MLGQFRDLLIIFYSSGSVSNTQFDDAKSQLGRLLGYLCPHPDPFARGYQHAALIRLSSGVTEIFDFDDKSNTQSVQAGILGM